jgi:hypothetical protein
MYTTVIGIKRMIVGSDWPTNGTLIMARDPDAAAGAWW